MPAPTSLSVAQRSHLQGLVRLLGPQRVRVDGYDLANRPVVGRTDVNGYKSYAIRTDGSGTDTLEPVVQFVAEDLWEMPNVDEHLLTDLTGLEP